MATETEQHRRIYEATFYLADRNNISAIPEKRGELRDAWKIGILRCQGFVVCTFYGFEEEVKAMPTDLRSDTLDGAVELAENIARRGGEILIPLRVPTSVLSAA
jgi:hypothetical protein